MGIRHDIKATLRASSVGSGSNWRAFHASAALFFFPIFIAAAILFFIVDNGFDRALWFLGLAVLCCIYWRYLLPEAIRRAKIHETLFGNAQSTAQSYAKKP